MFVDKPLPSERPTGMGIAAYSMARAVSDRGIPVDFVCRGEKKEVTYTEINLRVYKTPHYSTQNILAAANLLSSGRPEVFHVHSSSALPSLILAKVLGIRTIVHAHGVEAFRLDRTSIMRLATLGLCDRIVAVSQSTKEGLLRSTPLSPRKIDVVYNGVDAADLVDIDQRGLGTDFELEGFDELMLSIGAVYRTKRQDLVIDSLPAILKEHPRLAYLNAGPVYDKSYLNSLIERAHTLGVAKSVKFPGLVSRKQVAILLRRADLCVHPSEREGFPLAVLEEMACGKPVIAANIPSIREIIVDGVDGILLKKAEPDDLARLSIDLLRDRKYRQEIGESARNKVMKNFSWETCALKLEHIYRSLTS